MEGSEEALGGNGQDVGLLASLFFEGAFWRLGWPVPVVAARLCWCARVSAVRTSTGGVSGAALGQRARASLASAAKKSRRRVRARLLDTSRSRLALGAL